jgi:hypothetical protein
LYTNTRIRVAAKEREFDEILNLEKEYQTLRADLERMQTVTDATNSPGSFLEDLASKTVGQEKVAALNPAGRETREGMNLETFELKLSGVSLRELVELLYKLDTAGAMLRPARLTIKKRYKDPYTFDVTLTALAVSTR